MRTPLIENRRATSWARWPLAAGSVIVALALMAAAAPAADQPKVENPHGKFKADCGLCHAANAWKPAKISPKFNHASYGFPLTGAHSAAKCGACHASLDFSQGTQLCASCHQDPHRGEMGTDCARCHSARSFIDRSAMVRQHQSTRFPLTGSHAQIDCEGCHKPAAQGQMQFVGTRAECQSCHMDQYREAKSPDHVAGGFPTDCSSCHSTLTWSTKTFDHNKTAFPLTGAHRAVACEGCHGGGVYKGKSTDCYSCHQIDYTNATPNHPSSGFGTNCGTCHNTTSFAGAVFNHNTQTTFPLTGAHPAVACNGCHGDNVYKGKSTLCVSCHQADFNGTTDPMHSAATATFVSACESCHNTTSWTTATFNHSTATTFPLTGAHVTLDCNSCHGDNVYKGKNTLCYACHQAEYGTTVVNHASAGFGTACEQCHTTTAWSGGKYTAHDTQFKIYSGRHLAKWSNCTDCHSSTTNYAVFACYGACHSVASVDRQHVGKSGYVQGAGDSQKCYSCHRSV